MSEIVSDEFAAARTAEPSHCHDKRREDGRLLGRQKSTGGEERRESKKPRSVRKSQVQSIKQGKRKFKTTSNSRPTTP